MRRAHPLLQNRAEVLSAWLRKQLLIEAGFNLFQGLFFGIIGLIFGGTVAVIIIALLTVAIFGLRQPFASFERLNPVLEGTIFLLVVGGSIRGAARARWGRDYSTDLPRRHVFVDATSFHAFFNVVCELFYAGPSLYLASYDCLAKTSRLYRVLRHDLIDATKLILWLFDKGRKADVEEISKGFLGARAVRILPLLRDIPGVIWLTHRHGVIILSEELRFRLGHVLRQMPPSATTAPPPEDEPGREQQDEQSNRQDYAGSAEQVAWYVTLNLPPFAPLSAVKQRYRQLVKIHHPDMAAARNKRGEVSDEQFKRINNAYHNILKSSSTHAR
jgi:hypothetical protein